MHAFMNNIYPLKCVFVSYFNSNNIGDLLISSMLTNDIVNTGYIVTRCSIEGSFKIKNIAEKNSVKLQESTYFVAKVIRRLKNDLHNLIFWSRLSWKVQKSDLFIIGGGNLIMDLSTKSNSAMRLKKFVDIAKKHKKKIVVLTIGVGPFQTTRQKMNASMVLNECDYVTYRDQSSYDFGYIEEGTTKHYLSIDPVYRMAVTPSKGSKDKRTIGLGVINTKLYDRSDEVYENTLINYAKLARSLLYNNYKIKLFSTEIADYRMVDDLYKMLSDDSVEKIQISTIEDLIRFYSEDLSYLIAARMHSLIVAVTQEIPVIGISWQSKVKNMFDIIEQSDRVFEIDRLGLFCNDIVKLVKLDLSKSPCTTISDGLKIKLRERYQINNDILRRVANTIVGNTSTNQNAT